MKPPSRAPPGAYKAVVADVAFVLLTIVAFALLALVVRAVERL